MKLSCSQIFIALACFTQICSIRSFKAIKFNRPIPFSPTILSISLTSADNPPSGLPPTSPPFPYMLTLTSPLPLPTLKSELRHLPYTLINLSQDSGTIEYTVQHTGVSLLRTFPTYVRSVCSGFGRGSKSLGFATANLEGTPDYTDVNGVYCGWFRVEGVEGKEFMAVCNVGVNPSFGDVEKRIIECHLIDYEGEDFYGRRGEVMLMGFLREEVKFGGVEELKKQIGEDVENAREWLKDVPGCLGRGFKGEEGEIDWRTYMEGNKLGRHYLL
ncbi:hypothetical protein TrST_g943 [Triparma strigata]|uniref:riboflavin kinase n=1 Tax=Triparma strigata TaxID=1606541 RepID=A0A9W7BLJ4_9STRA|nr:hypothetical protein TrST_g943 [Triparma strigata]